MLKDLSFLHKLHKDLFIIPIPETSSEIRKIQKRLESAARAFTVKKKALFEHTA